MNPPRRPARGVTLTATMALLVAIAAAPYLFAERHQAPIPDTPEQTREKIAEAKAFVTQQSATMLSSFPHHTGGYPNPTVSLWGLTEAPPRVAGWKGPYLTKPAMPIDPWGQPYQYAFPGVHNGKDRCDVWSFGPDEKPGTADDINNW